MIGRDDGADSKAAENGLEGLRRLKEAVENRQPPELLLLDVHMHGMNGLALLEELGKLRLLNLIDAGIVLLTSTLDPLHIAFAKNHMAKGIPAKAPHQASPTKCAPLTPAGQQTDALPRWQQVL